MITTKTLAQKRPEQKKKGFTLTEIAIVLGIMGMVLGAIWVAASNVYNNQRVNQGQSAVLQVLQAVRTLYAQQAIIAVGNRTAELVQAGVIPTNLIGPGNTMVTPWGGSMYIGGTTDGQSVAITLNGMSTALCVGIVSGVAGASHDRTLQDTSVTAAVAAPAVPAVAAGTNLTTSVTPKLGGTIAAGTGTGCTAATPTNSVVFVFGLQG